MKMLRRDDVEKMIGMSRSTLYLWVNEGNFPRPYQIGGRAVAWKMSEIQEWFDNLKKTEPGEEDE